MEDHMRYIDDFFQGNLSAEEKKVFEERISKDPAFAANVAFYLSARQSVQAMVNDEKKKKFKELYATSNAYGRPTATINRMRYVWQIAIAAAVVAAIVVTVLNWQTDSPQQLANEYVENNYNELPVTMGRADDLQAGADLYNQGSYAAALAAFENIVDKDSSSFQAVQYAGLAALRIPDYEKALAYFRQLERFRAQFANPAVLLQGITLLKRNDAGDKAAAKLLLRKVVNDDLDGKATAERLLNELD